jgi:hypothetical protein
MATLRKEFRVPAPARCRLVTDRQLEAAGRAGAAIDPMAERGARAMRSTRTPAAR